MSFATDSDTHFLSVKGEQESVAILQDSSELTDITVTPQLIEIPNFEAAETSMPEASVEVMYAHVFNEVTAKVPPFLLNQLSEEEQLAYLVKLARDVNVNILVGMEGEAETEIQNFSYFGCLDSIIEIQNRVKHSFQMACEIQPKDSFLGIGTNKVSIGVNTEDSHLGNYHDRGIMCRLLEEPKYTRSGRQVKAPALNSLYDCEDDDIIMENSNEYTEVEDGVKTFHVEDQSKEVIKGHVEKVGHVIRAGHRKRGRPKKIKAEEDSGLVEVRSGSCVDCKPRIEESKEQSGQMVGKTEDLEPAKQEGAGEKSRLLKGPGKMENPLLLDITKIEEMLKTEKNPVQRSRLQKILYEERTPNKYSCKHCSFTTKRQSHLNKHEELHEKKQCRVYKCGQCDFKTIRKGKLVLHGGQCHQTGNQSNGEGEPSGGGFSCTQCQYKCDTPTELESHWRESHRKFVLPSVKKQLKCNLCDYATNKPKMLNRHMSVHKELPGDHLTELFTCSHEGCEYSTRSKGNFHFHIQGKHSTAKPYLCDTCGTKFKRKHSLKMHLKFVHVANNKKPLPFQCSICSKRFRSNAHLKEHLVKHTVLRQHLCSVCGVAFKTKSAAKRHQDTVHSNPALVRPVCDYCRKPFNSKYTLQRHLRAMDGKCGQADRLRTAAGTTHLAQEENVKYELNGETVDLIKHSFVHKDQVMNVVPRQEEGYTPDEQQMLTVEIPAVGQNKMLSGEENLTLMRDANGLVVLPTDGIVLHQSQDPTSGVTVTELPGQQTLLGNETLQGLLNGQLFSVTPSETQTQLMYISTN